MFPCEIHNVLTNFQTPTTDFVGIYCTLNVVHWLLYYISPNF